MKDLHCAVYAVAKGEKYQGTVTIKNETFEKGLIDKRLKWLGIWIKHDQNFNVVSIGRNVDTEERGFAKIGDPIWECTITGKIPQNPQTPAH
jgi:hypothetical protein